MIQLEGQIGTDRPITDGKKRGKDGGSNIEVYIKE